jgi:hypothetical protein
MQNFINQTVMNLQAAFNFPDAWIQRLRKSPLMGFHRMPGAICDVDVGYESHILNLVLVLWPRGIRTHGVQNEAL